MSLPVPTIPPITPHEHYGTGRLPSVDLRDHRFALAPRKGIKIARKRWATGPVLDQGSTPQCVGYSWRQLLTSQPVKNTGEHPTAPELYAGSQANDEWEGADYDGSSVRGGAKFLQAQGLLRKYSWAFDVKTAAQWVLGHGPLVFGIIWPNSLFNPVKLGKETFIRLDLGSPVSGGGHAICCNGADTKKMCPDGSTGAFLLTNSWGNWGDAGRAWISFADMTVLMAEDGECCTATEILGPVEARGEDIVE